MWTLIFLVASAFGSIHQSSISKATAEAGLAVPERLDAPFVNPAALPYLKGYFVGTGWSSTSSDVFGQRQVYSLSLTDNMKDTLVPSSLGYVETRDPLGSPAAIRRDFRLASANFFSGNRSLGFALNYRASRLDERTQHQANLSVGTLIPVGKEWGFGAIIENIFPAPNGMLSSERLPSRSGLGMTYNYQRFVRFRADLLSDDNQNWGRPELGLGLENYWNRWLIFRVGLRKPSDSDRLMASTGVGFAGPKFELHYSYQDLRGETSDQNRHSIDLGLPVW